MSTAMSQAISKGDVMTAKVTLDAMKHSLREWLRYRTLNDSVVAGTAVAKKPRPYAVAVITGARDMAIEGRLARQLYALLSRSFPDSVVPSPDVQTNPNAAVELAQLAIAGGPTAVRSPTATGSIPWLWPVLIVGSLLLVVTTAIKTQADVAKNAEQTACIEAGACTDSGFWLKAGGIAALAYVGWQLGVGDAVRGVMRRSSRRG